MSTFSISTQKLRTIWERVQKNINEIKNKDNFDEFEFFINLLKQQHLETPLEVFNSGEIIIPVEYIGDTPFKNTPQTTTVSYAHNIELEIPEVLLPFIKYSVEVTSIPDTEIHGVNTLDSYEYVADDIEVRGDGTLIFKADDLPNTNQIIGGIPENVFSDFFFTSSNISFDLTKEVWRAIITENDDEVTSLNVIRLTTTVITATGSGNCDGFDDTEVFEVKNLLTPDHKIISLSSIQFTAVGDFTTTTHTDTGSECETNTVVETNVTKSFTFDDVDSYTIQLSGGLIFNSNNIKDQEFERNNRWLFWSTLKQTLFQLTLFGSDGDFKELNISNFPDSNLGHTFPYSSITLKRNIINSITIEKIDQVQNVGRTERTFKTYVRTSTSNASIPKYRFDIKGSFLLVSRATEESENTVDFPVYNDIYTVVGSSYVRTTTDHSILSKELWIGKSSDVTLTIKGHLVNPLYWREQRRYIKNDV